MSRELKAVVLVDGVVYGPGYAQPDDNVAKRITNPIAWGEDAHSDEGHGVPGDPEQQAAGLLPHAPVQLNQATPSEPAGDGGVSPVEPPAADTPSSAVPAGNGTPDGGLVATGEGLAEPARSGKGSTEAAWRAFAESKGVQVSEDADRNEIIAACKDAGAIK